MPLKAIEQYIEAFVALGSAIAEKRKWSGPDRWKRAFAKVEKDGDAWPPYTTIAPGAHKPHRRVSRKMHDQMAEDAKLQAVLYPSLSPHIEHFERCYRPYFEAFERLDARKNKAAGLIGVGHGKAHALAGLERVVAASRTTLAQVRNDRKFWFNLIDKIVYQDGRLGHRQRAMRFSRDLITCLVKTPHIITSDENTRFMVLTHVLCRAVWRAYLWHDYHMERFCLDVLHDLQREFPDFLVLSRILTHVGYHNPDSEAPFIILKGYDSGVRTQVEDLHHSIGPSLCNSAIAVLDAAAGKTVKLDDKLIVLGDRTLRQAFDEGRRVDLHEGDLEGAAFCTRRYAVTMAKLEGDFEAARRTIHEMRDRLKENSFSAPLSEMRLIEGEADICELEWKAGGSPSRLGECGMLLERAAHMAENSPMKLIDEAAKFRARATALG